MSATDVLRRMLDERGVEYKTHDIITGKAVTWTGSVCNWVAFPDERGLAVGVYKDYLTPEQAIAATLGGEECVRVKRGTKPDGTPRWRCSRCDYGIGDYRWAYCPNCGSKIRKEVER